MQGMLKSVRGKKNLGLKCRGAGAYEICQQQRIVKANYSQGCSQRVKGFTCPLQLTVYIGLFWLKPAKLSNSRGWGAPSSQEALLTGIKRMKR